MIFWESFCLRRLNTRTRTKSRRREPGLGFIVYKFVRKSLRFNRFLLRLPIIGDNWCVMGKEKGFSSDSVKNYKDWMPPDSVR
jgi:hypothetical protein